MLLRVPASALVEPHKFFKICGRRRRLGLNLAKQASKVKETAAELETTARKQAAKTKRAGTRELQLIAAQDQLVEPARRFAVEPVA